MSWYTIPYEDITTFISSNNIDVPIDTQDAYEIALELLQSSDIPPPNSIIDYIIAEDIGTTNNTYRYLQAVRYPILTRQISPTTSSNIIIKNTR